MNWLQKWWILDQDDQILKNKYSETGMISFTFANLDCFVLQVYLDNWYTPKINIEPENDGFWKESPLPGVHVQVAC